MKKYISVIVLILITGTLRSNAQVIKILFDATKAETAGNADWVIDANIHNIGFSNGPAVAGQGTESNPQQIPFPAQSGITSLTNESFWKGGLSYWGIDCVNKGYVVETLPFYGQISYGNSSNAQDLSNYKVFVVCEPNILFTSAEKTAILNFVQNGGGLYMISDHDVSDRNGDGWDSPHIWNDLMSNNTILANPFGMTFDYADFSQTSTNIPVLPTDSLLHGPMGTVTKVQWSNGTSLTLDTSSNPTVQGNIYKNGSAIGNTNVMCAYAHYGNGKVAAMGDSSPFDDGSGDPNDQLYDGYITDAAGNHRKLIMNTTIWLAGASITTGIDDVESTQNGFQFFPNPANESFDIVIDTPSNLSLFNLVGKEEINQLLHPGVNHINTALLKEGIYLARYSSFTKSVINKIMIIH